MLLRCDLSANPTFDALVKANTGRIAAALPFAKVKVAELCEALNYPDATSHHPLYQLMFSYCQSDEASLDEVFVHDLEMRVFCDDELHIDWFYNANLFAQDSIIGLSDSFEALLRGVFAEPEQRIHQLPLMKSKQRQRVLALSVGDSESDSESDCPQTPVHKLFEMHCESDCPQTAVLASGDTKSDCPQTHGNDAKTYTELNVKANRLARLLEQRGVTPGQPVAVCLGLSPELIASMLAIFKVGGMYVPLDGEFPKARLDFIVKDAGVTQIVTDTAHAQLFEQSADNGTVTKGFGTVKLICLDDEAVNLQLKEMDDSNFDGGEAVANQPNAYIMYTSGSTRQIPKGLSAPTRACAIACIGCNSNIQCKTLMCLLSKPG